jgi:hypothetical protein
MPIINLVEQVKHEDIVLPAIQRDFVWSEAKIEKLFDSIMRGYPIGIVFLWETYNDIQYRTFEKDYRAEAPLTFHDNREKRRLRLVVDGQQRLQSLYIALLGTHEGKSCYFDVLSGRETEEVKKERYLFYFLDPEEAAEINSNEIERAGHPDSAHNTPHPSSYYEKLGDLVAVSPKQRRRYIRTAAERLNLSQPDQMRIDLNLFTLHHVLTAEDNILKSTVIDEDKPSDSRERKSEADVLEAFVRINREGTPLTRSDLISSMLKLSRKQSADALPEFGTSADGGNAVELDADSFVRYLYAVSGFGSKSDIDILRRRTNVKKIRDNFDKWCNAIRSGKVNYFV